MRTKHLLLIYIAGMAMTFDSLIWGRESFHSAFGGMITWVAVMIWIYNRGKYTIRKGEFCFILSFIVGTAIISFLVASLAKEPEISLAFTAFGLLLVLKCCIFGISSDAEIVYPYAGEILTVSTGLHLLTIRLKKVR